MTSPPGRPGPEDRPEQDPADLGEAIRTGRIPVVPGSLVDLVMQSGITSPDTDPEAAPATDASAPVTPGSDSSEAAGSGAPEASGSEAPDPGDGGLFSPGGRPAAEGPGTGEALPSVDAWPFDGSRSPGDDPAPGGTTSTDDAAAADHGSGGHGSGDPGFGDFASGDSDSALGADDLSPAGHGAGDHSPVDHSPVDHGINDHGSDDHGPTGDTTPPTSAGSTGGVGFANLVGTPDEQPAGADGTGRGDERPAAFFPATARPSPGPSTEPADPTTDTGSPTDGRAPAAQAVPAAQAEAEQRARVTPLPRRRDPRTPDGLFPVASQDSHDASAEEHPRPAELDGAAPDHTGLDGVAPDHTGLDDADLGDLGDDPLGIGPLPSSDGPGDGDDDAPATAAPDTPATTSGSVSERPSPGERPFPDERLSPGEHPFSDGSPSSDESPWTAPAPAVLPPISPAPTAYEPFPSDSRQSMPPEPSAGPAPTSQAGPHRSQPWPPRPGSPEQEHSEDTGSAWPATDRGGPATDVIPAATEPGGPDRRDAPAADGRGPASGWSRGSDPALTSLHDDPLAPRTPRDRTANGTSTGLPSVRPEPGPAPGDAVQRTGGNRPLMPGRPRPGDLAPHADRLPRPPRPTMPGRPPRGAPDGRSDDDQLYPGRTFSDRPGQGGTDAPARPPMPSMPGPHRGPQPGSSQPVGTPDGRTPPRPGGAPGAPFPDGARHGDDARNGSGVPRNGFQDGGLQDGGFQQGGFQQGDGVQRTAGHRRVTDTGPSTAVIASPVLPDAPEQAPGADEAPAREPGRRRRPSPDDGPGGAPTRDGDPAIDPAQTALVLGAGATGATALTATPAARTPDAPTTDAGDRTDDRDTGVAAPETALDDAGPRDAAAPEKAPAPVTTAPKDAIMSAKPRRGRGVSPGGLAIGLAAILLAALTVWAIAYPSTPDSPGPRSAPAVSPEEQALRPAEVAAAASLAEPLVRATLPIAETPAWAASAPSGRFTYLAVQSPPRLVVLAAQSDAVAAEVPLPGPPNYVSVSRDGSRAFASIAGDDGADSRIAVVDTVTNRVLSTVPATGDPLLAVPSVDGRFLYVAGRQSGKLDEVDPAVGVVTRSVPVAQEPAAAAPAPDGDRVYVANRGTELLTVLDPDSLTVLGSYKVGGDAQAVTAAPGGGQIAVAGPDDDTVSIMDPDSGRELATARVEGGPSALAWAPDGKHLYVGARTGEALRVVDTTTWQVVGSVPTGGAPTSVTVSPDGRTGWVTTPRAGTVTVLNLS
ncbi:collagen type III alpha [Pseudonocardia sediminis]|uniref:Collagen type III alpha n=1 Tax=Pseudonocardia sediminis TaxID=1397368 RepID=A0A4Q7US81_PSEST|nr:YncE family protein [Pseudonocardia sediminis]RZT84622.1 collagen type III alpha [Pseudonocardia sediminis]